MSFDGDLYPEAGATSVMTTKGDIVRYDSQRERYGIGSANQILQVKSSLPSWETVPLADTVLTTAGDILYEDATPALARLAKGTQYNTLQIGATLPSWSPSATSVLSTTGDLLFASGANTLARLAGGTSGDVLTANGAGVAPSYQTPAGGGGWEEIGTGTTSGSASQLLADFGETTKKYLIWYAIYEEDTGANDPYLRFGNGSTALFSTNRNIDAGASNLDTAVSYGANVAVADTPIFDVGFIQNDGVHEQWGTMDSGNAQTGASNAPQWRHYSFKYAQTGQIGEISYDMQSGNFIDGSTIKVWGRD